jgi:hypothetical protein
VDAEHLPRLTQTRSASNNVVPAKAGTQYTLPRIIERSNCWMPAGACHRAALCADPVAGMTTPDTLQAATTPKTHIAPVLGGGRVMQPGADGGDTRDMTLNDKSLLRIERASSAHPKCLQLASSLSLRRV